MAYADFGLDDTKKSKDDDEMVSEWHCLWCNQNVKGGFSMCFSNWVICIDCLNTADQNKKKWKSGTECFKCKGTDLRGYEVDEIYKHSEFYICEKCVDWGKDVINNQQKYLTDMIQDILKKCTVEGNIIKLPAGQLERKLYEQVKKKLELIGGKWKGGKTQGFVFEEDPTELLADVANGDDRNLKKEFQFFATPSAVAKMMMEQVPVIGEDMKVLEPSAGDGALIKALVNEYPITSVDCFELMDLNRKKLDRVVGAKIIGEDFLQCDLKDTYDIIIANPPFTKSQDIDHIRKMYECLKPGGTIITLSSPSWTFGSQKKQVSFKSWLGEIQATQTEIDEGAFKESGTTIRTVMLVIKKPITEIVQKPIPDTVETEADLIVAPTSDYSFLRHYKNFALYDTSKPSQPDLIQIEIHLKDFPPGSIPAVHGFSQKYKDASTLNKAIEVAKAWINNLQTCRKCGCTEHDCSQCIQKTGHPCHWVEADLCSACQETVSETPVVKYSDADLAEFKSLIDKKLESANKELVYLQGLIDKGDDQDSSMPLEQLGQMKSRQITFIDHLTKALERIENKTYGICRATGKLIDKERLKAVPHATLSVEAKKGKVVSPQPASQEKKISQPLDIIKDMEKTNKEIEKGTAELKQMLSPQNSTDMEFFQKLAEAGHVDFSFRILQKNGNLTINIKPGGTPQSLMPMNFTGTPAEFDRVFFKHIIPAVKEVTELVSNVEDVKAQAATLPKKAASSKTVKPKPVAKKTVKKKAAKNPVVKKEVKPQAAQPAQFS